MSESPDSGFLAEKFTHHGTDFHVLKLNAEFGHEVLEYIRPEIFSRQLTGVNRGLASFFGNDVVLKWIDPQGQVPAELAGTISGLIDVILTMEPLILKRLKIDLFANARYRNTSMSDYEPLGGNENDAFAGMPHIMIHVVIGRAFLVNFSDSFSEIPSLIPGYKLPTTSTSSQ